MTSPRRWSLAGQIFAAQVLVAVLVLAGGLGGAYVQARHAGEQQATSRVLAVAHTVAATPLVVQAVGTADPTTTLQPLAEQVRRSTDTDFVVVMSPAGRRWTHPDPRQIGRQFIGHIAAAAGGRDLTETYTGTLGPSVRAVVPVRDSTGTVTGLVSVGIRQTAVAAAVASQLPELLGAAALAAVLFGTGSWLVARRLRRQTGGLGAAELQEMAEYYDAVLHSVREGLLLIDGAGRVRLANDEARRLLSLPESVVGRPVTEAGLTPSLTGTLASGEPREDELHVTDARVLVLNQARANWQGRDLGTVTTLRDRTDLEALTGELDSARGLAEALRSQAHESANRLHTVVSLIELGRADEALTFATGELAVSQRLTDEVVASVQEPALAALLLGKAAQASERGIELEVEGSGVPEGVVPSRDLVTIVGNLVDNALEAVTGQPGTRRVRVATDWQDGCAVLTVSDTGPGLPPEYLERAFARGWSTKAGGGPGGRGLGLALVRQSVLRLGGTLSVEGPPGATFVVRLPARVGEDA
ncbi:MAG: ATP-binding protein [Oryzihumus sp.]